MGTWLNEQPHPFLQIVERWKIHLIFLMFFANFKNFPNLPHSLLGPAALISAVQASMFQEQAFCLLCEERASLNLIGWNRFHPSWKISEKQQEQEREQEQLQLELQLNACDMIWYDIILYDIIWYYMILYDIIWYIYNMICDIWYMIWWTLVMEFAWNTLKPHYMEDNGGQWTRATISRPCCRVQNHQWQWSLDAHIEPGNERARNLTWLAD